MPTPTSSSIPLGLISKFTLLLALSIGNPCLSLGRGQDQKPFRENSTFLTIADSEYLSRNELLQYADNAQKWTEDVIKLAQNNISVTDRSSILFIGSSSIRLWNSIERDVSPFLPIRRGYGGAKFCDLAIFTPALIKELPFRAAVVFIANDVTGSKEDKSPSEVARLAKIVIDELRIAEPNAPILLMSVTATPSRFQHWNKIREVNRELEKLESPAKQIYFLETESQYIGKDGKPIERYFGEDRLHQNEVGYQLWGQLITDKLNAILPQSQP